MRLRPILEHRPHGAPWHAWRARSAAYPKVAPVFAFTKADAERALRLAVAAHVAREEASLVQ